MSRKYTSNEKGLYSGMETRKVPIRSYVNVTEEQSPLL